MSTVRDLRVSGRAAHAACYDIRWVYKYDARRRLREEVHLSNTGDLLTRTTYTYETETRRVARHFAGGTEPLARVVETIDAANGNVVEEWLYDEEEKLNTINWIEQQVSERLPSEERAQAVSTVYRSITYYR